MFRLHSNCYFPHEDQTLPHVLTHVSARCGRLNMSSCLNWLKCLATQQTDRNTTYVTTTSGSLRSSGSGLRNPHQRSEGCGCSGVAECQMFWWVQQLAAEPSCPGPLVLQAGLDSDPEFPLLRGGRRCGSRTGGRWGR